MRKKKPVKSVVISFKVTQALSDRVDECADRTGQSRAGLAEMAIEAAVNAIEANNFRLVVPIEFDVRHIPVMLRPPEQGKASG